jgi:hypothetical protein
VERYTKLANGSHLGNHPDTSPAERAAMAAIVDAADKAGCFAHSLNMPGYKGSAFTIPLTSSAPVFSHKRRYSPAQQEVTKEHLQKMLDADVIRRVTEPCPYASCPVIPLKKDAQGNWTERQFCVDYRLLNSVTAPDKYSPPLPQDLFDRVGDCAFFSKMDLRSGFFQIPIAAEDQIKTAFWGDNQLYCFKRMPFGLRNAPAMFQRAMDSIIAQADLGHCAAAFIDDVLVFSNTFEEHCHHVQAILKALHEAGIYVHPDKSIFCTDVVEYLGYNLSRQGMGATEAHAKAISALQPPSNISELRSTFGLLNYYRTLCTDFSKHAAPIYALTRKGVQWDWSPACQQGFDELKRQICTPGKVMRRVDPHRPLILHTDWSAAGCASHLRSAGSGLRCQEYMCVSISRSCNVHERNYASYYGELLAAVWAIKTLHCYLQGRHFTLVTDHQPLCWLMNSKNLTGTAARWALQLQPYDFTVAHRPGAKHQNADALSRAPLPSTQDTTGACLDPEHPIAPAKRTPGIATALIAVTHYTPLLLSAHTFSTVPTLATTYMPTHELCEGNHGDPLDAFFHPPPLPDPAHAAAAATLRRQARSWLLSAPPALSHSLTITQAAVWTGPADSYGIRFPQCLDTGLVSSSFFPAAQQGVTMLALCDSSCHALQAALHNDIHISAYLYADIATSSLDQHHTTLLSLSSAYPHLLPPSSLPVAPLFSTLPSFSALHLIRAGALQQTQWLLTAGTPVMSTNLSTYAIHVLGTLQQLQPTCPPAYLLQSSVPCKPPPALGHSPPGMAASIWTNILPPSSLPALLTTVPPTPTNVFAAAVALHANCTSSHLTRHPRAGGQPPCDAMPLTANLAQQALACIADQQEDIDPYTSAAQFYVVTMRHAHPYTYVSTF